MYSISRINAKVFMPLLAFFASKTRAEYCIGKAAECNFFFDGHIDTIPEYNMCNSLQDNGIGFSDIIMFRGEDKIGVINSDDNVEVLIDWNFVPITNLDNELSTSQFKPFSDSGEPRIGHETFQGNSALSAENQCFKVGFKSWQVIGEDGNVIDNVNSTLSDDKNCIVFRASCDYAVPVRRTNNIYTLKAYFGK